jgi:hypothetical protein
VLNIQLKQNDPRFTEYVGDFTESRRNEGLMANAIAGWYDDGSGKQRWWDGQLWTDKFQEPQSHDDGLGGGDRIQAPMVFEKLSF